MSMLEQYMEMAKIPRDNRLFLFRHITKTKKGERLKEGGVLSYTTLRDLCKAKVKQLGYPAEKFGLHSLRAGGATAAANADVPDRLFKRHGRWKSKNAKDDMAMLMIQWKTSLYNETDRHVKTRHPIC